MGSRALFLIFQELKGGFLNGPYRWKTVQEIYCNYIIQGQSLSHVLHQNSITVTIFIYHKFDDSASDLTRKSWNSFESKESGTEIGNSLDLDFVAPPPLTVE